MLCLAALVLSPSAPPISSIDMPFSLSRMDNTIILSIMAVQLIGKAPEQTFQKVGEEIK